jgi:ABC-type molybdenum transport system ATPase subunit/photorepair protein PhrA
MSSSQPPPSDVLAIDVNNLTFKYNDEIALEDITMNVEQGER